MTFFDLITHIILQEPKEDARLQPPKMETASGVDGGNYCMVYIVLPNLHLVLISKLLPSSLTTYILLPDNLSCILKFMYIYRTSRTHERSAS